MQAIWLVILSTLAPGFSSAIPDADDEHLIRSIEISADGQRGRVKTAPVSMHGDHQAFLWGTGKCRGRRVAPHVLRELLAAQEQRRPIQVDGAAADDGARCLDEITFLAPGP